MFTFGGVLYIFQQESEGILGWMEEAVVIKTNSLKGTVYQFYLINYMRWFFYLHDMWALITAS